MPERFDVKAEAFYVEGLANRAGIDWRDRPAFYVSDAAKLSQEVTRLAQNGHLEGVTRQMQSDSAFWGSKGCAPKVWEIDRGEDGKISGIKFLVFNRNWDNPAYANVNLENHNKR